MSYEQVVVFKADRQFASRRYQDRFKTRKHLRKRLVLFIEKLIEIKEDGIYLIKE
jgi:hypothetical protein